MYYRFALPVMTSDEEYVRRGFRDGDNARGDSMQGLKWDGAELRKVRVFAGCTGVSL